jgi:hypothetical protein
MDLYNHTLWWRGELAGDDVRSEKMNKRHRASIELTTDRLVVEVRLAVAPASGGGETAAARLPRLELRRVQAQCGATSGRVSFARS